MGTENHAYVLVKTVVCFSLFLSSHLEEEISVKKKLVSDLPEGKSVVHFLN